MTSTSIDKSTPTPSNACLRSREGAGRLSESTIDWEIHKSPTSTTV